MTAVFRLMTANLLHQRSNASDFARVLAEHDPDVVVTQELGPAAADILAAAYPHHRLRPALDFTGRGIATRLSAEFGDIDMPGRDGTSAILDVGGVDVWLAGVHLLNPIHFPWWVSARERGRQLEGLFEWMGRSPGPTVVAGDFNASPRWPAYRRVAARLTDLVADWAAESGSDLDRTWAWRPGWPRLLRIDHVFGNGVRATAVEVDTIMGTDHNPVVVDLELDELF
jgi:endonuclease/exonuclease/phosphatase (EEP) superfamily protein YafD